MGMIGNIEKRCIYAYEFKNVEGYNYVYVGLTYNLKLRQKQHKKKGSLFKFCVKHNIILPQPKQLSDYIIENEASILEGIILKQYINDGWIPINKAKTGSLGSGLDLKQRTENFFKKAYEVHNNEYDYSEVKYISDTIYILIKHNICGHTFEQTPSNHLQKHGCPYCNGGVKSNKEEFIRKAKHIHGNKFIYNKVIYIDSNTKVYIICPIHGEFWQRPNNHLNSKYGCKECEKITRNYKLRKSKETFIEESNQKFGVGKFDFSNFVYINNNTKGKIICHLHGEFEQTPKDHLNSKYGCKRCGRIRANEKRNR